MQRKHECTHHGAPRHESLAHGRGLVTHDDVVHHPGQPVWRPHELVVGVRCSRALSVSRASLTTSHRGWDTSRQRSGRGRGEGQGTRGARSGGLLRGRARRGAAGTRVIVVAEEASGRVLAVAHTLVNLRRRLGNEERRAVVGNAGCAVVNELIDFVPLPVAVVVARAICA